MSNPNYRLLQQALTELNADGNEERGREGEELPRGFVKDILVSQEEASVGDVTDYAFKVTSDGYINTAPSGELPRWKKVAAPGHHAGVTEEQWAAVVKALHQENNS